MVAWHGKLPLPEAVVVPVYVAVLCSGGKSNPWVSDGIRRSGEVDIDVF